MKIFSRKLATIICSTMILSACSASLQSSSQQVPSDMSGEKQDDSTAVQVTKVKAETIEREVVYTGKVQPSQTINVMPKTSGEVKTVNFEVGDTVKAGDVLFTINTESIENEISKLKVSLKANDVSIKNAQLAIEQLNGGQEQTNLLQMQAAIDNAKIQLDNASTALNTAKDNYDKNKILLDSAVISQNSFNSFDSAYKQAQNAYEQANSAYKQAVENLKIYKEKTIKEKEQAALNSFESAKANKEATELQLKILEKSLADTVVTAPISGVISAKGVSIANTASPQTTAATILDLSSVTVDVNVSEATVSALSQGDKVSVLISTISKEPIVGKIKSINPTVDTSGTYPVKVEISNQNDRIKAGMFAQVTFSEEKVENAIVVPNNAVLYDETGKYVYIVENNVAIKKYVETGVDNGVNIQIVSGIEDSQYVVTVGSNYVSDQRKVRIVNELGEEVNLDGSVKETQETSESNNEEGQ